MNFNKAIIAGNLTRDPESRAMPSGQTVVNFGVATNRVWTDQNGNKQEAAEFHNVVAFGKLADICARYLSKGRLVMIEGRIHTSSWQDQSGQKKYRTEIVAENMQMGPKSAASSADSYSKPSRVETAPKEEIPIIDAEEMPIDSEEPAISESDDKQEINVKDIPF